MSRPIFVLVNPNAGSRKRRPSLERLAAILGDQGSVEATERLDQVEDAVQRLLASGPQVVAISGGDGTLGSVLNEALAQLGDADALPAFLPTNSGTIDFVAKKVGIRGDIEDVLERLTQVYASGGRVVTTEVDSLQLTGTWRRQGQSEAFKRVGFALAAGGIGQRFFAKYYAEPKLGAPAIVKVVLRAVASHALAQLPLPVPDGALSYGRDVFRPTRARVTLDGEPVQGDDHGAIHAGAFEVSLGGVFRVFPMARERGVIHFQAGGIVPKEMILALPSLVLGRRIPSRQLVEQGGRELRVEALGPELLAPILDGEPLRDVETLTVTVGPRVRIATV